MDDRLPFLFQLLGVRIHGTRAFARHHRHAFSKAANASANDGTCATVLNMFGTTPRWASSASYTEANSGVTCSRSSNGMRVEASFAVIRTPIAKKAGSNGDCLLCLRFCRMLPGSQHHWKRGWQNWHGSRC